MIGKRGGPGGRFFKDDGLVSFTMSKRKRMVDRRKRGVERLLLSRRKLVISIESFVVSYRLCFVSESF